MQIVGFLIKRLIYSLKGPQPSFDNKFVNNEDSSGVFDGGIYLIPVSKKKIYMNLSHSYVKNWDYLLLDDNSKYSK